jgi:hypothetical protein
LKQYTAWAKNRHVMGIYENFLTIARINSPSFSPLFGKKGSKSSEFHTMASFERVKNFLKENS